MGSKSSQPPYIIQVSFQQVITSFVSQTDQISFNSYLSGSFFDLNNLESVVYEVYLAFFLVFSLFIQFFLIYNSNLFLMDIDLFLFISLILFRRMLWNLFKFSFEDTRESISLFCIFHIFRATFLLSSFFIFVYLFIQVASNISYCENLIIFFPALLYFSMFGVDFEPRRHRFRYSNSKDIFSILSTSPPLSSRNQCTSLYPKCYYIIRPLLAVIDSSLIRQEIILIANDFYIRLKQWMYNVILIIFLVGFLPLYFINSASSSDYHLCYIHCFSVIIITCVLYSIHFFSKNYTHLIFDISEVSHYLSLPHNCCLFSYLLPYRLIIFSLTSPSLMLIFFTFNIYFMYYCYLWFHYIILLAINLHGLVIIYYYF